MKIVAFRAPGKLSSIVVTDAADPGPARDDHMRVRIRATSLNGHDYNVATGLLPVAEGRILMSDGAGVVEAIGPGVRDFAVGDHVISTFFTDWQDGEAPSADFARTPGDGLDGYAAEIVVRPANWFTNAPRDWSFTEAATLPTAGLTAWRALVVEGGIKAGDDVLVLGTGGVAILALQLARQMGARVIVTSSSESKLALAKSLGAAFGINYRDNADWGAKVRAFTGGRGVDLTVETAGPGTLPQSMEATRIGGRIVLVGVLTGIAGQIPTAALMGRQQHLQGITVGSRRHQLEMVRGLEATGLRPVIDRTFTLHRLAEAFRYQESGRHFGKICVEY